MKINPRPLQCALLILVVSCWVLPAHAQIYTSDATLTNFTLPITTYATLSQYSSGDTGTGAAPVFPCTNVSPASYTPTAADVANGLRVFCGTLTGNGLTSTFANNWIEATFPSPVSTIVVFPNIDHFGSAYDGYQYAIWGSNDNMNWTPLFDATNVGGTGPFTLTGFTGTGPLFVNNVLTNGLGPGGTVGYEAFFVFGTAYKYYAFGASTFANASGNTDTELTAVGTGPAAITQTLHGSGALNSFVFPFGVTYDVIYPSDVPVAPNITMTISPIVLAPADCTGAIDIPTFAGNEPSCTTFAGTTPANFSVVFDVACSVNGAPSTSQQCLQTTGFNPFVSGAFHNSEDIGNILVYSNNSTQAGNFPQMLTAHEGNNDWVEFGVGFQFDCCTRGAGGSNYNSMVVAADFPASAPQFAIPTYDFVGLNSPVFQAQPPATPVFNTGNAGRVVPVKWDLFYPTDTNLGYNGGPVTNLTFPQNGGYLSIQVTQITCPVAGSNVIDNAMPTDIQTNTGLINDGNGAYHINWQTSKSMAGECFALTVNTGDGVNHTANFQLH